MISTAGAELLDYRNIARFGPTTAALSAYLIPIVGILAGTLVLGEPLTSRLIVGTGIVLGSIALAFQRPNRTTSHGHDSKETGPTARKPILLYDNMIRRKRAMSAPDR